MPETLRKTEISSKKSLAQQAQERVDRALHRSPQEKKVSTPVVVEKKKTPVEKVLYGVGKAVTYLPEKQEQFLYKTVYEKYIFPKLSSEHKKQAKAMEPKIKYAAKVGGWIMTGGEVIVAGVIVNKIYAYIKRRSRPSLVTSLPRVAGAPEIQRVAQQAEDGLPPYLRDAMDIYRKALEAAMIGDVDAEESAANKQGALFMIGNLFAHGMPPEIADKIKGMRGLAPEALDEQGIDVLMEWYKMVHGGDIDDPRGFMNTIIAFRMAGFQLLTKLEPAKLRVMDTPKVLGQIAIMFGAFEAIGSAISPAVREASEAVTRALAVSQDEDIGKLRRLVGEGIPMFTQFVYSLFEKQGIAPRVNGCDDRSAQFKILKEVIDAFIEKQMEAYTSDAQDESDTRFGPRLSFGLAGLVLQKLGFPGLEKLGIRLLPNREE